MIKFIFAFLLNASLLWAAEIPKIFVLISADHPALEQTKQGLIEGLKKRGYEPGKNSVVHIASAQGSPVLAKQLGTHFMSQNPDVIVTLGTGASQAFLPYAGKSSTAFVFSSVTDPVQAGLTKDMVGVTNYVPFTLQLAYMQEILPSLKKIAVFYNPGEANSVVSLAEMQKVCLDATIQVVLCPLLKASDALQAVTLALQQGCDACVINNDNTSLSAFQTLQKWAFKYKKPFFVSDVDLVQQGALGALGADQKILGLQTAMMVADKLERKKSDVLQGPQTIIKAVNQKIANALGIHVKS